MPRTEILYVEHPVSPEQKAELLEANPNHRIVDARFAPPAHKAEASDPVMPAEDKPISKGEARAMLEQAGVEIPQGADVAWMREQVEALTA